MKKIYNKLYNIKKFHINMSNLSNLELIFLIIDLLRKDCLLQGLLFNGYILKKKEKVIFQLFFGI